MRSISGIFNKELATLVAGPCKTCGSSLPPQVRREGPYEALVGLLGSMFDEQELQHFLFREQRGKEIISALQATCHSVDEMAFSAVAALQYHHLIDARFFARLLAARPANGREITWTWRLWARAAQQ